MLLDFLIIISLEIQNIKYMDSYEQPKRRQIRGMGIIYREIQLQHC